MANVDQFVQEPAQSRLRREFAQFRNSVFINDLRLGPKVGMTTALPKRQHKKRYKDFNMKTIEIIQIVLFFGLIFPHQGLVIERHDQ